MGKAATYIVWEDMLYMVDSLLKENKLLDATMLYVGSHVGMRWNDLKELRWETLLKGTFQIKESKRGKVRTIRINKDSLQRMNELFEKHRILGSTLKSRVIQTRKKQPVTLRYANMRLQLLAEKFNLPYEISTHSLRKAWRVIYDNDPTHHTLLLLQEMYNHSDVGVTIRYLGIRKEEIDAKFEQLKAY